MDFVEQGALFLPDENDELTLISDGVLVWNEEEGVIAIGSRGQVAAAMPALALSAKNTGRIITPPSADTHTHTFQPDGIPGVLIENVAREGESPNFQGWLPKTLKFESKVRANPEEARAIAQERFAEYIQHGITASLEYTTSSIPAARIVLEEARKAGLGGRIKVGYVAMDQEIDFIEGVHLEVKGEENQDKVLGQIRELAQDFPNQIVIIDRFPIAVSSGFRKKLAQLALQLGVLYETHVDESEGEFKIHSGLYQGRRIIEVLQDDGVFAEDMKVGLAHGIHTNADDFARIEAAIKAGVKVDVRFCPDSNESLGSHVWDGEFVAMPFQRWHDIGARVTLGTDKGAGTGWSVFAEALKERGRFHAGRKPSELELLGMATVNGLRSLDLNPRLMVGQPANFIVVNGASAFRTTLPTSREEMAALTLRAAQTPHKILSVVVNGRNLKASL